MMVKANSMVNSLQSVISSQLYKSIAVHAYINMVHQNLQISHNQHFSLVKSCAPKLLIYVVNIMHS